MIFVAGVQRYQPPLASRESTRMFEVRVQGRFRAIHRVRYADGQWEPSHPHDWSVEARYRRPRLTSQDWVVDFVEVQRQLSDTLAALEGTDLNQHPDPLLANPTAERVAQWLYQSLTAREGAGASLYAVGVEEAPGCRALFMQD
jgi:6-pyruvoyltetrahydropterin/6-carboxytetrahydropterin synthase